MLFLALAVLLLAPFKAISTPLNAVVEDPCITVRACCAAMKVCCCEISPAQPKPPSDMASSGIVAPAPKFVAIKGSGKIITQDLPRLVSPLLPAARAISQRLVLACIDRPLYILHRALLI